MPLGCRRTARVQRTARAHAGARNRSCCAPAPVGIGSGARGCCMPLRSSRSSRAGRRAAGARLGGAAHGLQQVVRHPGLEDVLPDAGLVDAGDDVLAVGVAGDDDAHRVRPALAPSRRNSRRWCRACAGRTGSTWTSRRAIIRARLRGAGGGEHLEVFLQRAAHRVERTRLVVDRAGTVALMTAGGGARPRCRGVQACGLARHEVVARHVVAGSKP